MDIGMDFEILGEIQWTETIATGRGIRELRRLNRVYGKTTWKKKKGIASPLRGQETVSIASLSNSL